MKYDLFRENMVVEGDPHDNVLTAAFLVFGAVNHLMIELMRRFILSRPPGRRMVRCIYTKNVLNCQNPNLTST